MAKTLVMEELHLTFRMKAGLSATAYAAAVRTLRSRRFQQRLRGAVRDAVARFAALQPAKVKLSC